MNPRYIVHIGPLNTGSTYLQECLTAARLDLEAQGVCYPSELLDENAQFMHMPVHRALARGEPESLRPAFERINRGDCHTVLISCEHMIFLKAEAFAALQEVSGASDMKIVYTCRRWSDRIPSIWNHTLFMGAAHALPEFFLGLFANQISDRLPKWITDQDPDADIDYSGAWRMVESVLGRGGLQIFPYSDIIDRGGDVFDHFCRDVLELPETPYTHLTGMRRWASLPTDEQEILRMLNRLHIQEFGRETDEMRAQFMMGRAAYDTTRLTGAIQACVAPMVIDDNSVLFDHAFEQMSAYTDCVVGGDKLFTRRAKATNYAEPWYLLEPGMREDLAGLYHQIKADIRARRAAAEPADLDS